MHVNELPSELLINIFSYFKPEQLGNLALVCTKWRDLSRDPILWTSLSFITTFDATNPLPSELCCKLLARCPLLRKLNIGEDIKFDDFRQYAPKLNFLKTLSIICNNTFVEENNMAEVVLKCPAIENLHLQECFSMGLKSVEQISMLPNLHTLVLKSCNFMSDECIKTIAENCHKLKHLDLGCQFSLTDAAVFEITKFRYETLQHLMINCLNLSDASLATIRQCTNLSFLSLNLGYSVTDQTLRALAMLPSNLLHLQIVNDTILSKTTFERFLNSKCCSKLKELTLKDPVIDDQSLETIVRSGSWKELQKLTISSKKIQILVTDKSLITIVRNCKNLRDLTLMGLEYMTGEFLYSIPDESQNFEIIFFIGCPEVRSRSFEEVAERFQNIAIMNI